MGMIASSAALAISDIPFRGPIGAVRIGFIDGKFIINPGQKELETTRLNLVVAGTADAIMMVEGGANELTEDQMLEALETAHREIKKIVALLNELVAKVGKPKRPVKTVEIDKDLAGQVAALAMDRLLTAIVIPDKMERQKTLDVLLDEIKAEAQERGPDQKPPDRNDILQPGKGRGPQDHPGKEHTRGRTKAGPDPADQFRCRLASPNARFGALSRAARPRPWS